MAKPLIDWYDDESRAFINPLLPEATRTLLHDAIAPYSTIKAHIWLASSGTENFPKMIALSKKAMLVSAEAVNHHLQAKKQDRWLNILPLFHTGGLAIHARALLTDSLIYDFSEMKWDPLQFVKQMDEFEISFSSLTPTHVYDLISRNLPPPKSLKAIIVGGGVFPEKLHEEAFAMGWPFFKSYGMTEVCSQIATALSPDPKENIVLLKHIELRFNAEKFIEIKSDALLTGFIHGNDPHRNFIDPKVQGWYTTQDMGSIDVGVFKIEGRGSNFIKIGGENVSFSELESVWENIKFKHRYQNDAVLIDLPDDRLGKIICLAVLASEGNLDPLIAEFHKRVIPLAKIRHVFTVESIPRTELFKLKRKELIETILKQNSKNLSSHS